MAEVANTMETLLMPPPPKQRDIGTIEDAATYIHDLQGWITAVQYYQNDLYNVLHSGYLVRAFQVESLTADTITSGTITVDQLYLGDSHFELDGLLGQIRVKDNQAVPVTMFEAGTIGGSDYGIKVRNSSNTVVFQALSVGGVFMDGAVINNATITGAKLVNATVGTTKLEDLAITTGKLANAAVTNAKISDLSASKITVSGTLTCSSSTTAIAVTSSGQVVFSAGGDMIFKATASDSNFISFRNSANSERGSIQYSPTSNIFYVTNANGSDLFIDATYGSGSPELVCRAAGTVTLQSTGSTVSIISTGNIAVTGTSFTTACGVFPSTNDAYNVGSSSKKWANMWTVVDHVGDIEFDNGWRITEPDKVWDGRNPSDGIVFMNSRWEPVMMIDQVGNLWVKGYIAGNCNFLPPNVARIESKEEEHGKPVRTIN